MLILAFQKPNGTLFFKSTYEFETTLKTNVASLFCQLNGVIAGIYKICLQSQSFSSPSFTSIPSHLVKRVFVLPHSSVRYLLAFRMSLSQTLRVLRSATFSKLCVTSNNARAEQTLTKRATINTTRHEKYKVC